MVTNLPFFYNISVHQIQRKLWLSGWSHVFLLITNLSWSYSEKRKMSQMPGS